MKKLFAFVLLSVFLISFTSAFEFDNVASYNEELKVVTITNAFGAGDVIGQAVLKSDLNVRVPRGYGQVAEFDIWAYDDYSDALKQFYFEDMRQGRKKINREYDLKKKGYEDVEVNDYITECYMDYSNATNATEICNNILNGTHTEQRVTWTKVSPADLKKNEVLTIGVFTEVQKGDYVDWIPTIYGVEVPEWATWTESMNVKLVTYYTFNETSGQLLDSLGFSNSTTQTATQGIAGIINGSYDYPGDTIIPSNTKLDLGGTEKSFSFWLYPITSAQEWIMSKGAGGDAPYQAIFLDANRTVATYFEGTGDQTTIQYSTTQLTLNQWNYVVINYNLANKTISFYFDGVFDSQRTYAETPGSVNASENLYLGSNAGANDYTGRIDEMAIRDREMVMSEIIDNWNGGDGLTYTNEFGFAPSVILVSPANNSNLTSPNIDFIATVTDDQQVSNVTLYIDGVANETNTSGFNGSYTFSKMINEGLHNWSILAIDNQSLENQSETFIFNLTIPPIFIDLLSPPDVSTHNTPLVNMSCTAYKNEGVTQLNLTINGVVNISITNSSIAENLTISQDINFSEDNYTWGCSAINPSTSAVSANRTFEVLYSNPVINLFEPENDTTILIENVTFTFNASDVNGIDNVSLFIGGILNETNTSGIDGNYSFFRTLQDGIYNWSVRAISTLGKITNSSTRFFLLHTVVPTVNVSAPSGVSDYFLLGNNETLIYNISEAGENVSHFEECWYNYNGNFEEEFLSNSSLDNLGDYWNIITGGTSNSENSLLFDSIFEGPSVLRSHLVSKLSISPFSESPDCFNENYSAVSSFTNSTIDYYACIKNSDNTNFYYVIKQNDYNITTESANFSSFNLSKDLNCSENQTNFTYINGQNNITVFAEDEFSFIANDTSSWEYLLLEINQTFINETTEGNTQNISALVKLFEGETISAAILDYNGQLFVGTSAVSGENTLILKSGLVTPNVETAENITFHWSIVLSSGQTINLSSQTQLVNSIGIDNCSNFTNKILNISMVDEEEQTPLSNTTLEIALDFLSSDRSTTIISFSQEFNNENPVSICLDTNITESTQYSLDAIIRYVAEGYANEYYNIVDTELTNETGTINLTLYDLNESDSTEFQLTFTGEDFLPVENALVLVERQYIAENAFKTVELPKTDSNGQTIIHLVRNDVIYNIVVMKDGVILGNFANVIAFCEDFTIGACSLPLNAISNTSLVFNYDDEIGIIFEEKTQYNKTTGVASFSFASVDGTTKIVNMRIERRDVFGNRSICENTLVSSSGSISCQVDTSIDDTTLVSIISVNGEDKVYSEVTIDSTAYGQNGYAIFLIFAIALTLMFSGSKTWTLVGVSLNYIVGVSLGLIVGGIAGAGSTGIFVLVITIVGIWQLNKERKQ